MSYRTPTAANQANKPNKPEIYGKNRKELHRMKLEARNHTIPVSD